MEFQPIYKTTDQINSDAESFLKQYYSFLSIPIPIEEIIDLKLQIDIIPIPGLKEAFERVDLDIDAFISSDFKSISVDRYVQSRRSNRYRFSLAHEIGHTLLHGYLYNQFEFDRIDEWIGIINSIPLYERGMVEWQANEFAGLILVPRKVLKDEFCKVIKINEKKFKVSFEDKKDLAIDFAICSLAQMFCVSEEVMRIRFERDGLIER